MDEKEDLLSSADPKSRNAWMRPYEDVVGSSTGDYGRLKLGGVAVDLCSPGQARARIESALAFRERPGLLVGSVNLDHIHHFGPRTPSEHRAVGAGDGWLMTVDGAPISWAVRRATGISQPRICGSDFLPELLTLAAESGHSVGFLGGTEEASTALSRVLAERYPDVDVRGHWTPPRSDLESPRGSRALADEIRDASVELLVVGLGKPRQELWLQNYAERCGVSVALAFGASTDFLAGMVRRAPAWAREHGMEWFYRLYLEPRRLARRYLVQGPRALGGVLVHPVERVRPDALVEPGVRF